MSCNGTAHNTVKRVLNNHSQKDQKLVFKTNYLLMQVKSIAECSKWSILQFFLPSLSYQLLLRSSFCLFLSGRLTQVLLYLSLCNKRLFHKCCFFNSFLTHGQEKQR